MTDLIGFINLLSGVVQIGLGFFVLFSDFRSKLKRYYFVFVLFLGLWSLSIFFYSNPVFFDPTTWLKIVYTVAYCMTLGLVLFARVYPKKLKKKFKTLLLFLAIYMSVMTFIMWTTDYVVQFAYHIPSSFNSIAVMGPLYFWYGLPEFIAAIYVLQYYIKKVGVLKGIEKKQVQLYILGGVFMIVPIMIFDFVFPLFFENTAFYKYGTIGNAVWTIIIAYAILTTRFLDIRVIVSSFLSYFIKSLAIFIFLLAIFSFFTPLWGLHPTTFGFLTILIISFIITLILNHLFLKIDDFLSEKFVYIKYNPVKNLRTFSNQISQTVELNKIVHYFFELVLNSFQPKYVSMVLLDSKKNVFLDEVRGSSDIKVTNILKSLDVWGKLNSNRILIYSELKGDKKAGKRIIDQKREAILDFMRKNNIEIIFSLKEESKFDGVVLLGQKHNGDSYSVGDIDFLDSVMQNFHMALVRATLYLELQSFNEKLQEQVNAQTQELKIKVKELEEARIKERDMIDIMGHELRTPASIVKLNVGFLEEYVDSNPKEFKKYLDRIKSSIENEIKLINTLLSSAKLEGKKLEINREEVDIKSEIDLVLHAYEVEAKVKGLELQNKVLKNTPNVYSDKVRTIEILDNLIGNAVKYTNKGNVSVHTEYDDRNVKVSIIDTGPGIPKKDISKLGTKFHRAGNYIESNQKLNIVRPGGTGLGLYVTYKLLELMGGKIWVQSKEGKGSKFVFTLPVYNKNADKKIKGGGNKRNMFVNLGLGNK